jgi:hypothetical protein
MPVSKWMLNVSVNLKNMDSKMNERLKELSRQAWEYAENYDYTNAPMDEVEFSDILEQKFAALIIEECIINLDFHGHTEAASQLLYLKTNRFGIK